MLKNDEVFISDVRLSFSLSFAVSYTITKEIERETYGTLDDLNRVLPVTSSYGVNTRSSFTRHNFFFSFPSKFHPVTINQDWAHFSHSSIFPPTNVLFFKTLNSFPFEA